MKAIIHIGTLKTGSTSIQNSLFSNRELLLNRGIIYPDIGSNFQHWGLFTAFMDEHPSNFHILRDWGWGKEKSEKWSLEKLDLIRQSAKTNRSYMIISAEDFHRINFKIKDFKIFLDDLFEEYTILLYGRSADSYYASWISEFIGQGVKEFTSPIAYKDNLINVVNLWKSVFGDNLIARPFNSKSLVNGDVVDDFLEITDKVLGVNLRPGFIKVHENVSPSGTAIALIHLFNQQNDRFVKGKLNPFWFNTRQLLRFCPASEESPKLSFSKEVREIIRINNLSEWKQFIKICHESCERYGLAVYEESEVCEEDITPIQNQTLLFDFDKWVKSYFTSEGLNHVMTYIFNQYNTLSKADSLLAETKQQLSSCSSQIEEKEVLLEQTSNQLHKKTQELEYHKNLEQLLTKYYRKIETTPNLSFFHCKLGETLANEKELLHQAISEFRKAIEIKPDSALSYGYLGEILIKQGSLEEAVSCLKKAIELKPKFYRFYNGLGLAFIKQEKWDEAISCFKQARELKPDSAWAYYNLGLIFSHKGKFERASTYYAYGVNLNPSLLKPKLLSQDKSYLSKIGVAQWDVIRPIRSMISTELTPVTENSTEELCTFNIDKLEVTDEEQTVQILLAGWIFGHKSKVVSVQIIHDNSLIQAATLQCPRMDVVAAYPHYNLQENTGFNSSWKMLKKLIGNKDELVVKAVFFDGTCVTFKRILLSKQFVISDLADTKTDE